MFGRFSLEWKKRPSVNVRLQWLIVSNTGLVQPLIWKVARGNKMKVMLNAKRSSYAADEPTMTVGELIEYLKQLNEDDPIYLKHDGGYTYGSISHWDFEEVDDEEEDEEE